MMRQHHLLVIDDDRGLRYSIKKSLERENFRISESSDGRNALALIEEDRPDVILLDLRLASNSGLDVLKEVKGQWPDLPIIMFTAFSSTQLTIEASKLGAFDYLLKPVDLKVLLKTVQRAILRSSEHAQHRVTLCEGEAKEALQIVGSSRAMQEVYKQIGRFAPNSGNILILGESGTGKELVARAIHAHSKRSAFQFLPINCAALSETLLESELFGHEKDAFTGASKRRIGKFEQADGGTIFLDEVGDMSLTTQAKVLRLLQEQRFERLGGNVTIATHVRIIAATNRKLAAMVKEGSFRADLYYRLNVLSIELPALRDRKEDIGQALQFFTSQYLAEFGKERMEIDSEIMPLLMAYDWPGNVRELQSAVKYALAHSEGSVLSVHHLPPYIQADRMNQGGVRDAEPKSARNSSLETLSEELIRSGSRDLYQSMIDRLEQVLLPRVLRHTRGNLQQACDHLGISRNTLKSKMRQQGIRIEHWVLSDSEQGIKDQAGL